ncbi:MAG: flavodoxin family protein [Candidatus Omnitrophica bacterium]|nr:flavodoxin family protein [Candidatus Omnitrophota bacterium]
MKTLIIFYSVHHNNTEKIARMMAKALMAELLTPDKVKFYELHNYDLIGFGSGIYFGRHHKMLISFAGKLPALNKKTFIFSTSGRGVTGKYHDALKEKLSQAKCEIIGEFTCKGYDTFGPLKFFGGVNKEHPTQDDLEAAKVFAYSLKNKF